MKKVLYVGLTALVVCVPEDMSDEEIERFANTDWPTGISSKWKIRTERMPDGSLPRGVGCSEIKGNDHVVLNC